MKIQVERNDLLKLISKAQNIVDKRNTMPVLTNVLIEAEDNILRLYATDLEVSVKSECGIVCEKNGKAVVSAKSFFDILKELPEGPLSLNKLENNSLTIEQGKAYFHINGMNPDEFPVFPSLGTSAFSKVSSDVVKDMIEKTIYSVSNDETRYHLNGVLFEGESDNEKTFRMVATDGHRLSLIDRNLSNEISKVFKAGVIVPRKGLNEIRKIIETAEEGQNVEIAVDGAQLILKTKDTLLMIRLIEGKYPNYKQLLPKNLNLHAVINKEQLMSSLKRVSLLSNQKSKGVTFNFSNGMMQIFSNSPDLGEAKEELEISYDSEDLKIGFNAKYILDVLSSITEDNVKISFKDKNSPVLLAPQNDSDYKCVVMPMRI